MFESRAWDQLYPEEQQLFAKACEIQEQINFARSMQLIWEGYMD